MNSAMPQVLNSICSKTKSATPGFFEFISEWTGKSSFDRDRAKEKLRWTAIFEQRVRSTMAEEPHMEIGCANQAWLDTPQAVGDDPAKQPRSESPISVDIYVFGVGIKKSQGAT